MRFGKLPPKYDYRTLYFQNYVTEKLPDPPEKLEVLDRVCSNLEETDPRVLFPMYANDIYGDCTIAGAAHGVTNYSGMVSERQIPKESEVLRIYFHLTGGVDSGLYMLDVVNYWRRDGIDGDKIFAFASVKPSNHKSVKQAIMLFGGLFMGFQVPSQCMEQFSKHEPWTPGPLLNAGHAVFVTGYDKDYLNILTWGSTQKGTWDWWDSCVDEAFALLPPEAKHPEFSPGFDFEALKRDLSQVAR